MKKYLAIIPVLAVAFAFTVAPAFGSYRHYDGRRGSDDKIEVKNWNGAEVMNDIDANSNTGRNDANRNSYLGRINTGAADSLAGAETWANDNQTAINVGRYDRIEVENWNGAHVVNDVDAKSNTGDNDANNNGSSYYMPRTKNHHHHMPMISGRGVINTGDAISTASAVNMLNSNVTRINN
jgi:hypothetical protein